MKKLMLLLVLVFVCFLSQAQENYKKEQTEKISQSIESKMKYLEKSRGVSSLEDSVFCFVKYKDITYFRGFSVGDTVGVVLNAFLDEYPDMEDSVSVYIHTWELKLDKKLEYYNVRDKAVFQIKKVDESE